MQQPTGLSANECHDWVQQLDWERHTLTPEEIASREQQAWEYGALSPEEIASREQGAWEFGVFTIEEFDAPPSAPAAPPSAPAAPSDQLAREQVEWEFGPLTSEEMFATVRKDADGTLTLEEKQVLLTSISLKSVLTMLAEVM